MSKRLSLGIFDSGLGGLTGLKELMALFPEADIVYFGDTARIPYGTRSPETIIRYSVEDMNFITSFDVEAVLVACGTVSSTALPTLREMFHLPIFGVIDSSAEAALKATENGKIGVIGTDVTIASGAYERAIKMRSSDTEVYSVSCPLFVSLVECGFIDPESRVALAAAEEYLSPMRKTGIDTLILGCTHYPIIAPAISKVLPGVKLVSSGKAAADSLFETLSGKYGERHDTDGGTVRCYVSDKPYNFDAVAKVFMGGVSITAEQVDIREYQ
ncbi:MAG: glutamate racemase [Clostridia bacterium]|nr:glutamate racemase [Clostridia bacterium]